MCRILNVSYFNRGWSLLVTENFVRGRICENITYDDSSDEINPRSDLTKHDIDPSFGRTLLVI